MTLRIRLAKPDDMGLILDAWRRSYEDSPAVKGADREHYRIEMTRAIRRLCDRAEVRVACNPDDEDHVVGFVAFTGREFHYGYVKQDFRSDTSIGAMLGDTKLDSYTFRGHNIEEYLLGYQGCRRETDEKGRTTWKAPQGWRFTPRFTI